MIAVVDGQTEHVGLQDPEPARIQRAIIAPLVRATLSPRRATDFVQSLLGLDRDVPDFSTPGRRRKTLAVSIPHRGLQGPLHLLIDSTRIKVGGKREWNARRHGGAKRRVRRKIHLGIAAQRGAEGVETP